MPTLKPVNPTSVQDYLDQIDEPRRSEILALHSLITKTLPDHTPYIQSGMIGYGKFHYQYPTGREGDWFKIGLASNKSYISLYNCCSEEGTYLSEKYKNKLGKVSVGRSCIRFKTLEDLDLDQTKKMLKESAKMKIFQL